MSDNKIFKLKFLSPLMSHFLHQRIFFIWIQCHYHKITSQKNHRVNFYIDKCHMLILCISKKKHRRQNMKSNEWDSEKKKSWRSQWIKKDFPMAKKRNKKNTKYISEEESEENSLMESHEKSIHSQQVATIFLLLCLPVVHVSTIPFKRAMKKIRTMLLCNHHHWISIVTSKTLRDISLFTNIFSHPSLISFCCWDVTFYQF